MLRPNPLPPGFIAPCLPIAAERCKNGPAWVHEIKHDGYRLIARRTDDRVRLYTRRGFNWADRYPRIVEAQRSLPVRSIVIDGEAVVCGKDGKSDFDTLHSGTHDASVFLYGFDLIDGEDLRPAPLEQRKGKLEKLLARNDGMRFSARWLGVSERLVRELARNSPHRGGGMKRSVRITPNSSNCFRSSGARSIGGIMRINSSGLRASHANEHADATSGKECHHLALLPHRSMMST
jgi:ATP dependent DNA ligase domain